MSHVSSGGDDEHRRKRVRKGTHSCWECKRRKVRCVFRSENQSKCQGCLTRGTGCQTQRYVDDDIAPAVAPTVPDRIGRLEILMQNVLQRLDAQASPQVAESSYDLPTPSSTSSPIPTEPAVLSLFDNEILSRKDNSDLSINTPGCKAFISQSKADQLRQSLLAVVPSWHDLELVLRESGQWWQTWLHCYPGICVGDNPISPTTFARQKLSGKDPTAIAEVLLCFAISLQQLPFNFDWGLLEQTESEKDVVETCITAVAALLTDDDMIASVEGLECLTLSAKLYLGLGRPRKAWLAFRRAMNMAEIMGLHRAAVRTAAGSLNTEPSRKQSIWWQIYQGDRLLSLLLGLSHGMPDSYCELERDVPTTEITYIRKAAMIASKVIDRNQTNSSKGIAITRELDAELEALMHQMPSDWWTVAPEMVEMETSSVWTRFMPQLWHFQVGILLHLPYMLRSNSEPRFGYNRIKCLEAARGMTSRYLVLNNKTRNALKTCKTAEFQAFIATVVIVLNLLEHENRSTAESYRQARDDWCIVDDIILSLRRYGKGSQGVETQAAEVLETLRAVGQNEIPHKGSFTVNIPYFGAISIARGPKQTALKAAAQMSSSSTLASQSDETPIYDYLELDNPPSDNPPASGGMSTSWPNVSFTPNLFPTIYGDLNMFPLSQPNDSNFQTTSDRFPDLNNGWDWTLEGESQMMLR